jgi:hypothetical protein
MTLGVVRMTIIDDPSDARFPGGGLPDLGILASECQDDDIMQ